MARTLGQRHTGGIADLAGESPGEEQHGSDQEAQRAQ
jgi:hypothetical protein